MLRLRDLGKRCRMASLLGLSILLFAGQFPRVSSPAPSEPLRAEPWQGFPLTPTPAVQPAEHLEAARIYQRNGDYQSAIAAYKAALASGASQEQMGEARYRLGESYLASGSYKLAVDTLNDFLREHRGSDKWYPQTFFLLARAYHGMGDWAQAIQYYRTRPTWPSRGRSPRTA